MPKLIKLHTRNNVKKYHTNIQINNLQLDRVRNIRKLGRNTAPENRTIAPVNTPRKCNITLARGAIERKETIRTRQQKVFRGWLQLKQCGQQLGLEFTHNTDKFFGRSRAQREPLARSVVVCPADAGELVVLEELLEGLGLTWTLGQTTSDSEVFLSIAGNSPITR